MKQRLVKLDVLICVYQCLSTNFIPSPYEISPCWSPIHGYIQYIQHTKQQRFCGFHLRGKGVFGSQGAPQVGPNGSRSPLPSAPSWNLHGGWGSGSRLERVNVSYVGYLIGIIKWTKQPLYVLCFVLLVSLHFFTYYIYIYTLLHRWSSNSTCKHHHFLHLKSTDIFFGYSLVFSIVFSRLSLNDRAVPGWKMTGKPSRRRWKVHEFKGRKRRSLRLLAMPSWAWRTYPCWWRFSMF